MSRKTKDDLEAEIQELLAENKDLRYMVNTNHEAYQRCIKHLNLYRDTVAKQFKGPRGNKIKAEKRHAYLIKEYEFYRAIDVDAKCAWKKANDELEDQFGKGYGRTQLNKIIEEYESKK